eukprot:1563446-Prymnesium_polylepis.1
MLYEYGYDKTTQRPWAWTTTPIERSQVQEKVRSTAPLQLAPAPALSRARRPLARARPDLPFHQVWTKKESCRCARQWVR